MDLIKFCNVYIFILSILLTLYSRDEPYFFFVSSSTNVNNNNVNDTKVQIPENHTFNIAVVTPFVNKMTQTVPI